MDELMELKLIKRLKSRDETALLEVIDIYAPLIKTIVYKRLAFLPEDKEEVINDIFLKIWENIEMFNPNLGSLEKWIAAISNYEAIDKLRSILRKDEPLPLDEKIVSSDDTPEDILIQDELYNQLLSLLDNLKVEDRKIFLDPFFQGESYEEVSKKYGINISNLYNRVSRGRKALRDLAKEEIL